MSNSSERATGAQLPDRVPVLAELEEDLLGLSTELKGSLRVQAFETGGYNSRIYAYENGLPLNFAVPQFAGSGFRYYVNLNYTLRLSLHASKKISLQCSAGWAQTCYLAMGYSPFITEEGSTARGSEFRYQMIFRKN